ncbi:MAG: hypothetical protein JWO15_286 [Sphingomonadales bacterium]|nr:hypothetical protein [Sphingomonadales bacterium]
MPCGALVNVCLPERIKPIRAIDMQGRNRPMARYCGLNRVGHCYLALLGGGVLLKTLEQIADVGRNIGVTLSRHSNAQSNSGSAALARLNCAIECAAKAILVRLRTHSADSFAWA